MTLQCRVKGHDFEHALMWLEYDDGTSQPLCRRRGCNARGERLDRRVPVEEVVLRDPEPNIIQEEEEL